MTATSSSAVSHWLKAFTFVFYMTPSLIVSNFPLYFESLQFSHPQIGFLFAIGPFVGIGASIFWGLISDRWQRIRLFLLLLLVGQALCLTAMFQTESFAWIVTWLIGFYFFQTPMVPLTDAYTLLILKDRSSGYGSYRIYGSLGFAFAAVTVGIWLKASGLGWLPLISLLIIGLSGALAWMLPERRSSMRRMDFTYLQETFSQRKLWIFLFFVLILAIAHRVNDAFMALYVQELGGDVSWIGWCWAAAAVSEVPFLLWTSRAGERIGPLFLLTICASMYALRFLLMFLADSATAVFWIQMMHSVTFGLFLVTAIQAVMRWVPEGLRATGQALLLTMWVNVSGVFTGVVGGWAEQFVGFAGLYAIGSVLALIAAFGFARMHWLERSRP